MNRKGKQKNSPRKAPIYRSTERLISWAMPVVDSLPKSLAAQTLGGIVIRDLHDCLDTILIAISATDETQKLECIKLLNVHLTAIATAMRVFTENRYMSIKQEADFLDLFNPITSQAQTWLVKWGDAVAELS